MSQTPLSTLGVGAADSAYDVRLSKKERFLFSLGDFNAGAFGLVIAVYTAYLVMNNVGAALAGIIIMIGRIWGAFADPIIGALSDNTRTKYGRRRPYIFTGGVFIFFSFAMLFLPLYKMPDEWFKFGVYLSAYLMFSTVGSMLTVPANALATEMTVNHDERNKVNTLRTIISFVSSLLSAGIPIILTESLSAGKITVPTFSLIMIFAFGAMYAAPTILSAVYAKERLPVPKERNKFSIREFIKPLKQRSFLYLALIYALTLACADLVAANIIFMADYGLSLDFSAFMILAAMMFFFACMIPIHGKLMKTRSKPFLFRAGIPFYIAGVALLCFYPDGWNDYFLFAVAAVIGVGMSGCQLMPGYIFPDVVDIGELKFHTRNAGAYNGIMTFMQKILSAVLIGLSGIVLDYSGFVEPTTDLSGTVTDVVQSPSAVLGLRLVV
ncbi:MAG: MFS transporter, partial [Clostridiales bacterium]|nr:MFS transporter [Clostridiales bacterium]